MIEIRYQRQVAPRYLLTSALTASLLFGSLGCASATRNPLPSWNDGPAKQSILEFVEAVTDASGPGYVPPERRIATFDNDGTLWCEMPVYTQVSYTMDRVRAMAADRPEWRVEEPYKAAIDGDMAYLMHQPPEMLLKLVAATHGDRTTEAFEREVKEWLRTARHPQFERPYTRCVYQPMLELLAYLRANGFKTFICSGGGIDFVRAYSEEVYGIPPEQVIGSSLEYEFRETPEGPVLFRTAELDFFNDKAAKPASIQLHVGRRPIFAAGNSDGDLQMLQWTAAGSGPRLMLLVHHTDAAREYAYDRGSKVGRLEKALDQARERNWVLVSMKEDWREVFPPFEEGGRDSR